MKFLLISFLFLTLTTGCNQRTNQNNVYKVLLQKLPKIVDPLREDNINIYKFIFMHLYYPLMEKDNSGKLKSHYLDMKKTKTLDRDFRSFSFCLKQNITYTNGKAITISDLEEALVRIRNKKSLRITSIKKEGSCAILFLQKSSPSFFDNFTSINSAILSNEILDNVCIGIGPYKVSSIKSDNILLKEYKNHVVGSFKRISFIKYREDLYGKKGYDFNHIYHYKKNFNKKNYQIVKRPINKTYYLLLRVKNDLKRLRIAKCFKRRKFLKMLKLNLISVPGHLPKGILGYDVDFDRVIEPMSNFDCKQKESYELTFYNYNSSLQNDLELFFQDLGVEVRHSNGDEAIRASRNADNMMTLIGSEAVEFDPVDFFMGFTSEKNHYSYEMLSNVAEEIKRAKKTDSKEDKEHYFKLAHNKLLKSGYVIPLGQFLSVQYYPLHIRGLYFNVQVHGFPQINLMSDKK